MCCHGEEANWRLAFLGLLRRLGGAPALFPQVDVIDFFNGRTPPPDMKSDTPTWGNSLGGTPPEFPHLHHPLNYYTLIGLPPPTEHGKSLTSIFLRAQPSRETNLPHHTTMFSKPH